MTGAVGAIEQPVTIHNGFLTGNAYLQLAEEYRISYAMGIVDGMMVAPYFGAADSGKVQRFGACATGMSNTQVAAILS